MPNKETKLAGEAAAVMLEDEYQRLLPVIKFFQEVIQVEDWCVPQELLKRVETLLLYGHQAAMYIRSLQAEESDAKREGV